MSMTNIKITTTWLDLFPTEIIFEIFYYLSNNDIIYTFFLFNQRFNKLILENPYYLSYLELPTTNLNFWKNLLKIIGSKIECLYINTIDLCISLNYFSNLKSLIISSSYELPDDELKLILKYNQFQNLKSIKLKEKKIFFLNFHKQYENYQDEIFRKIFNSKNSLEIFQYSSQRTDFNILQTNLKLHSLILILVEFHNIFELIEYTPNLKYLNIQSRPPLLSASSVNKVDIKLKKFYLKFDKIHPSRYSAHDALIRYNHIIDGIKQFSSSLTCLSLDLTVTPILYRLKNRIPLDSIKLQQFLETMIELKQFHLYAQISEWKSYDENILSSFQNQFWFDHNWSFGMHKNYFYTLPFHFDYLYQFSDDFNQVKSTNSEILINNPRIWYSVKSIQLIRKSSYNRNFIKELKTKMPKLTSIKFTNWDYIPNNLFPINNELVEEMNITLNNVTTVKFSSGYIEDYKEWLIHSLPNLKHLILSNIKSSSFDSQIARILNEKIQRLDINSPFSVEQITSEIYFLNVQHIYLHISDGECYYEDNAQRYADSIMKIFKNFKKLKTLLIYIYELSEDNPNYVGEKKLREFIKSLNMNESMKNYQFKQYGEYHLISKKKSRITALMSEHISPF